MGGMNKVRMCLVIVVGLLIGVLGAVQYAGAQTGIKGSKHDLSTTGASSAFGLPPANQEICIFCHTPHFTADPTQVQPLWNRTLSSSTYDLYSSSTLDSQPQQPFGVSKACLSCHDGTVGFNALLNNRGSGNPPPVGTDQTMPDGFTRIAEGGTNLSNDHPISMRYSQAASPSGTDGTDDHATGFYAEFTRAGGTRQYVNKGATTVDANALPLYSDGTDHDFVQCGTCHDPHRQKTEADAVFFLRKSNVQSGLCLTCHKKDG